LVYIKEGMKNKEGEDSKNVRDGYWKTKRKKERKKKLKKKKSWINQCPSRGV
jgi:hypothetical protein